MNNNLITFELFGARKSVGLICLFSEFDRQLYVTRLATVILKEERAMIRILRAVVIKIGSVVIDRIVPVAGERNFRGTAVGRG